MSDLDKAPASPRDEKLSVLAALVGPATLERLRASGLGDRDERSKPEVATEVTPDRLAWHQNRLLQRLRARLDPPADLPPKTSTRGHDSTAVRNAPNSPALSSGLGRLDARIAAALDPTRLADEHPAVLAHILTGMDRAARVETLRALPGHTARAAIRRMRDGGTGQ